MQLAFNRKDFETLLKYFGFERIKIKGYFCWV
jgi:hypothetical protein